VKTISICIPVYNEASNLPAAIAAVQALFNGRLTGYQHEIIITDNASTDDSWRLISEFAGKNSNIRGYRFSRNFGYQNSIFAGLSLATGDAVIELDADLEDPPEVITQFVERWEQGFDVVFGIRSDRQASWIFKIFFTAFYRLLNKISDFPIPENAGDFRLLDRKVVEVLKLLPERNLYLRGLVSFLGFKQCPVIYKRNPRRSGNSKFRPLQYLILAFDALTAFSKTPLRLMGVLGLVLFFISMGLGTYYLASVLLFGAPTPGFATLVVLMLFLHSITFIFLGVLGEYLSRIFDDAKKRPRVVIQEQTGSTVSSPTIF